MRKFEEGQEGRIIEAVRQRAATYGLTVNDTAFKSEILSNLDEMNHIVNIGASILCTKWGIGYPGGSFVTAIVNNDLMEAFGRADHINLNAIRFYVSLIYNQSYIG